MNTIKLFGFLSIIFIATSSFIDFNNVRNSADIPAVEEVGDCAKYVKDYGEFVDQYIEVLKKYKANPSDMAIMSDYSELAGKAAKFAGEQPDDCGTMESLKLAKIGAKLAKAMSDM
jgi:hypothetical protein